MKEFTISKNDAGQRMDKFITKAIPKLPSSLLYKYIIKPADFPPVFPVYIAVSIASRRFRTL